MAGERTVNPYRTYGPRGEDGPSWEEYFRGRADRERLGNGVSVGESSQCIRYVDKWGVGNPLHRPRSLVAFVKQLEAAGFEWKAIYTTTHQFGGQYGDSAEKAGQRKPDRYSTGISFAAVKPGYGYCRMLYEQVNGGNWKCEWRQINGEYKAVSDKELKEWITNA